MYSVYQRSRVGRKTVINNNWRFLDAQTHTSQAHLVYNQTHFFQWEVSQVIAPNLPPFSLLSDHGHKNPETQRGSTTLWIWGHLIDYICFLSRCHQNSWIGYVCLYDFIASPLVDKQHPLFFLETKYQDFPMPFWQYYAQLDII